MVFGGSYCRIGRRFGTALFRLQVGPILAGCNARPALIWIGPEHPPGFRIDQVQPRANRAGDRLISLAFAFGRIVSDPALHVHACIRAAVDERGHRV